MVHHTTHGKCNYTGKTIYVNHNNYHYAGYNVDSTFHTTQEAQVQIISINSSIPSISSILVHKELTHNRYFHCCNQCV